MADLKVSLRRRGSSFALGDRLLPITHWNYVEGKPSTYTPTAHTHDDRYYTEAEINSLLSSKYNYSEGGTIDVNSLALSSRLYAGSSGSWTNRGPTGHNGSALLNIRTHSGNYMSQLWFDTNGDKLYHRTIDNGVIRSWRKIYHEGSKPTMSELDGYTKTEVDNLVNAKANVSHNHNDLYYTESEINTLLNGKSNTGHTHDDRYYTETEVNTLLSGKANTSHSHGSYDRATNTLAGGVVFSDIVVVDGIIQSVATRGLSPADIGTGPLDDGVASTTGVWSGSYISGLLAGKASTSHSHTFASITSKPTTLSGYGITDAYTKAQVDTEIDNHINAILGAAPSALDTLNELAAALGDDPNFATTMTNELATKFAKAGGTISGNVTIDNGTSTTLSVKADDGGVALIRANGDNQSTGAIEVGQSDSYGGGISYNGDGTPAFVSGESADRITFYRLTAGARHEVFSYSHSSDQVQFNATPIVGSNAVILEGDARLTNDRPASDVYAWAKAASKPTYTYSEVGAAAASHNHDSRYYTETEINTLLSGKSNTGHTHDDRYYTETEVNNLLAGKSDSNHTHSTFDRASSVLPDAQVFSNIVVTDGIVTAIATKTLTIGNLDGYSQAEVDNLVDAKVPLTRTVNGKALSTNITLSAADVGAAASSHAHSTFDRASSVLSGSSVFSNLVVTDGITTSVTTRNIDAIRGQHGSDVKIWKGTLAQWNAIGTKDANTLYIIVG